jgi:proline iminopeptidase
MNCSTRWSGYPLAVLGMTAIVCLACSTQSGSSGRMVTNTVRQGLIDAPGARLYYTILGQYEPRAGLGSPILVVHGGPGMDHTYLLPGMSALSWPYPLILYDQRGGGRTQGVVDASTVSFDRFLDDIDVIRDSLRLGKMILLGHSWGGLLAMRYAARHPDRVRALILMNTAEPGQRYRARALEISQRRLAPDSAAFNRLARSEAFRRGDSSAVNSLLRLVFRTQFADTSKANLLQIRLDPRTAQNMSKVATLVMGPLGAFDMWNVAADIRVPTLIIHGTADAIPIDMPRELARTIRGAQFIVIEDVGHFPYIEKPNETSSAINEFLRRIP